MARHTQWLQKNKDRINQVSRQKLSIGDSVSIAGVEHQMLLKTEYSSKSTYIIYVTSESQIYPTLRKLCKAYLVERTNQLAGLHQLKLNNIIIKDQSTRWGSCSTKGNINLNWRLALAPLFVSDYVIAHELAHLTEMNHSSRFWELVKKYLPNYQAGRKWLKEKGHTLHQI